MPGKKGSGARTCCHLPGLVSKKRRSTARKRRARRGGIVNDEMQCQSMPPSGMVVLFPLKREKQHTYQRRVKRGEGFFSWLGKKGEKREHRQPATPNVLGLSSPRSPIRSRGLIAPSRLAGPCRLTWGGFIKRSCREERSSPIALPPMTVAQNPTQLRKGA